MDKKILVLGGSSFLGKYLRASAFSDRMIFTYKSKPFAGGIFYDSLKINLKNLTLDWTNVSHAVILLGITEPDSCARNLSISQKLNVESIQKILDFLDQNKITPIFFSSEFVFDGQKGFYDETDQPNPILTYGKQKLAIEEYILHKFRHYTIFRLAKTYSKDPNDSTLFSSWLRALEDGAEIQCAYDQIFSPIYVDDVVKAVFFAVSNHLQGLFHLAGPEPFKRTELLEILCNQAREFGIENGNIISCSIHDFNLVEKRPLDVSMNPGKFLTVSRLKFSTVQEICLQLLENKFNSQRMKT